MKYIKPNFEREWDEAVRYPEFEEMGMESWVQYANENYDIKSFSKIKDVLGNVDLNFEDLEDVKKNRFEKSFQLGKVEIPIAVKFSEEDYDLVAGNTRLAGLVKNNVDPKIWIIDMVNKPSNDSTELQQNEDKELNGGEESHEHDDDMVSGVAEILKQIEDIDNRKSVFNSMIEKFKDENVNFDKKEFSKISGVESENEEKEIDEDCWKGYKQVGGKMKNGKMVPNCVPKNESIEEASNPAQQAAIAIHMKEKGIKPKNESTEEIDEGENKPTKPELWSRAKSMAKSKFDVYPSAYANGWASKWYKEHGGGWRKKSTNESEETIEEDLRRWFKEKWVDVSKKVDGKHPPCGRKDADGKSYPKCRPSKKVSKETPKIVSSYDKDEKKAMTQQKRRAEKEDPKVGKGNKPTMTHYEKKKDVKETDSGSSGSFEGPAFGEMILKRDIHKLNNSKKPKITEATDSSSSGQYDAPFGDGGKDPLKINGPKSIGKSRAVKDKKFPKWGGPGGVFIKIKEKCKKFPYCNQGDINAIEIMNEIEGLKETIIEISEKHGIPYKKMEEIVVNEIKLIFI